MHDVHFIKQIIIAVFSRHEMDTITLTCIGSIPPFFQSGTMAHNSQELTFPCLVWNQM